jgi:NADH:ubiquinone oxidoreductase subunit E
MDLTRVDEIIEEYGGDSSWLVMILQDIQEAYNYLPEPALRRTAAGLGLGLGHVYNVATFYSSFSLEERGKHVIRVCDGTACHLRGAVHLRDEITRHLGIREGETTADKMFTLEVVACLGACALAPVMAVDAEYHGQMSVDNLRETLEAYRQEHTALAVG